MARIGTSDPACVAEELASLPTPELRAEAAADPRPCPLDLEAEKAQPTSRDGLDSAHDRTVGYALATDILAGAAVVAGGISLYFTVKAATSSPSTGKTGTTRVVVAPRGVRLVGSF